MIPKLMCDGNPDSPICIVGDAPTVEDLEAGVPFSGPNGALLWSMAQRAGFTRADAYCLYTIGDWPEGKDDAPSPEQLDKYWQFFDAALLQFSGGTILTVGPTALWRVTGLTGVLSWRGYLVPPSAWQQLRKTAFVTSFYKGNGKNHKKGDKKITKVRALVDPPATKGVRYVVPALSPSSVQTNGYKTVPALAYDIDRAWRAATNALNILDFSYSGIPSNLTMDHEAIAVDIETTWSRATGTGFINRIGFANALGAWSANWNGPVREHAQRELDGVHDRFLVGHNLCFDIPELEKAGVRCVGRFFDTMLAAQLLQPDLFKGLNSAASLYLDTPRWKHLSDSQPELYNAHDVIATYYLYQVLTQGLKDVGAYEHFTSCVMPALRVLMDMNVAGLKVDVKGYREWQNLIDQQLLEKKDFFAKTYPTLAINSPKVIANYIWDVLGPQHNIKLPRKRNADESTLMRFAAKHPDVPIFKLVLEYRELNEYKKRFDKLVPDTRGIVYPSYSPGTKDDEFLDYTGSRVQFSKGIAGTGRIQAKDPSPQNLPKKARRIFIPHSPDSLFMEFDYDSAELRVCAGLSRDPDFLAAVNLPDIHRTHSERWGCTRDDAKTIVYATLYGSAPRGLQNIYTRAGKNVTEQWCESVQQQFFASYPVFSEWRRELVRTVNQNKRLSNPFGRPRYFWNTKSDIPAALDFLPQSTVADIVWSVLHPVRGAIRDCKGELRTIVHDSFLLEVPSGRESEAYEKVKKALERPFDCIAPGFYLPTKCKVGKNWGELTPYVPLASPTPSA